MSDLKKNILEKISDQEITPKSRWWYIIGHVSLWSVFVLAILVGSLAFGMLIFEIFSSEWQLAMMVRET